MIRLRLYVTGSTASAEGARRGLRDLEHRVMALTGQKVRTEVVDVLDDPDSAGRDEVFATPTLIHLGPGPQIRIFGDLSSPEKLMHALKLDVEELPLAQPA